MAPQTIKLMTFLSHFHSHTYKLVLFSYFCFVNVEMKRDDEGVNGCERGKDDVKTVINDSKYF